MAHTFFTLGLSTLDSDELLELDGISTASQLYPDSYFSSASGAVASKLLLIESISLHLVLG